MRLWPFSSREDQFAKSVTKQLSEISERLLLAHRKLDSVLLRVLAVEQQGNRTRQLVGGLYRLLQSPRIRITGEDSVMANVLIFDVDLPAAKDTDTVSRNLRVTVGDQPAQDYPLTRDDVVVSGLKGPQGASVKLELSDTDDAGNSASYPVVEFALADTIPPAVEGAPSARVTGEE